jgi:hypothetical protein
MLLLAILILRADVYAAIGDTRALQCIEERTEEEWSPRIGLQEYSPTQEMVVTRENEAFLEAVAQLILANTTLTGLLNHLQYVLKEIERISDQPTFLLPGPGGGAKMKGFNWKMTLRLVGISLAITPLNPIIEESIWDVTERNLKAICNQLNRSELFADNRVETYDVDAAMSSLEMLFMSLDAETPAIERTQLHVSLPVTPKKRASNERLPNEKKKIKPGAEQEIKSEIEQKVKPESEQKVKIKQEV